MLKMGLQIICHFRIWLQNNKFNANANLKKFVYHTLHLIFKTWVGFIFVELLETFKDEGSIDFVWHMGDIGYADDSFGHTR